MSLEHFRTMLQYNRWANGRILDRAALAASEDYYAEVPGLSFGTLHNTLVHALIAEIIWLARWRGELPPEHLNNGPGSNKIAAEHVTTFEALTLLWREEDAKLEMFVDALTDEEVEGPLTYRNSAGQSFEQPLHELIGHFVNHGTHFRAEAAVRLTQLNLSPGDLDLIVYLRQR